jgi:hypothetical protein
MQELNVQYPLVCSLRNSQVKATGKVGLSLQTNFFKTINYNVDYQPIGSHFTVRQLLINSNITSWLYFYYYSYY